MIKAEAESFLDSFFLDYPIKWNEKNMRIGYFLLILIILVTNSVHNMVFSDGLEHLDKLLHNEERSRCGVIAKGLRIRKDSAYEPISNDL